RRSVAYRCHEGSAASGRLQRLTSWPPHPPAFRPRMFLLGMHTSPSQLFIRRVRKSSWTQVQSAPGEPTGMSALGHKRTKGHLCAMSAYLPKADTDGERPPSFGNRSASVQPSTRIGPLLAFFEIGAVSFF